MNIYFFSKIKKYLFFLQKYKKNVKEHSISFKVYHMTINYMTIPSNILMLSNTIAILHDKYDIFLTETNNVMNVYTIYYKDWTKTLWLK